jgi:16S rRNA pseudouridine516 synthase
LRIDDILFSQGFGTRRTCAGLVQQGHVRVGGRLVEETQEDFDADGLEFDVDGVTWPYQAKAYLMLNKPPGTECSRKPGAHPSIYSLLPAPLRNRPAAGSTPGVQAVGRLDQDTTGLLLLSDDGAFIHRMNSPRRHVPKVYEVMTRHAVDSRQVQKLLEGVVLDDDPHPVRAAACEQTSEHGLRLTLTEGKYHQVKRMIAAVGNRVDALHRSRIGGLHLPADLAPGEWRWLAEAELVLLRPES